MKTSGFCWNNNCVIINMHGKTTIKIAVRNISQFYNGAKETNFCFSLGTLDTFILLTA
jgi:hypothetical protein